MMKVKEYADDINKKVEEIIDVCQYLKLDYITNEEDILNEEDIIELDTYFASDQDDVSEVEIIEKVKKTKTQKKEVNKVEPEKNDIQERKKEMYKSKEKLISNEQPENDNIILYKENMSVKEFSDSLGVNSAEVIKKLFSLGIMVNINNSISFETAELLATDYNKELKKESTADISNFEEYEIIDAPEDLVKRPPVVTIMGHVDHGKTTLLDTIRKSDVALNEAGGITQAISAYQVNYKDQIITFIDTPGHEAFTGMRLRGAQITDIVIIIVAADDGVMPQTKEAIDHAKAAGVPIMVAINKIDKEGANPERIMTALGDYGLMPDTWGGDTLYCNISALNGIGIEDLLENVLLLAEMNNYKANPNRYSSGTVIESRLDKQVGAVVTLLVQNGTLRLGDPIVIGKTCGKVRTMKNEKDQEIIEAKPSQPVSITGVHELPLAGDRFMTFETEKKARVIWEERKGKQKDNSNDIIAPISLDELFSKIKDGVKEINIIIKSDVNGSSEAVKGSLEKIDIEGVRVKIIRNSVGAITEGDVILAKASNAIVIGFNVRPNNEIKNFAKDNNVEIRLYNIIYKIIEDLESAMKGMLDPSYEEKVLGSAEVRKLFHFSKIGVIAGSYVIDGIIKNNAKCRLIRDGIVIYEGNINSIQREKDSVKEVKKGFECGITIENYNDLKEKDIVEAYEMVEIKK